MEAPARLRGAAEHLGVGEVGVPECPALEEPDHEDAEIGPVVKDLGADPRLGGRDRVEVLVVAVDGEQRRVAVPAAYDEGGPARPSP